MSNVASLENCKRLYELSGWGATEKRWYGQTQFPESCVAGLIDSFDGAGICPAYDAGYLLRKLPDILMSNLGGEKLGIWITETEASNGDIRGQADTPENALCLLAINLFEQGILTREDR